MPANNIALELFTEQWTPVYPSVTANRTVALALSSSPIFLRMVPEYFSDIPSSAIRNACDIPVGGYRLLLLFAPDSRLRTGRALHCSCRALRLRSAMGRDCARRATLLRAQQPRRVRQTPRLSRACAMSPHARESPDQAMWSCPTLDLS